MTQWIRFRDAAGVERFGTLDGQRIAVHAGDPFAASTPTGAMLALSDVTVLPPCRPSKILALWNNYRELAVKLDKQPPKHPLFLIKPPTALAGHGDLIRRPASYAGRIAFEGELAIVIGRRCADATPDEAADCILGYTCINDVTAVDLLNEDPNFAQWCRAKAFDTFACLGPVIATEIDLAGARVVTRVDGVERQNYPLSDMIFSPAEQVSLISRDMSLLPGDVIACGTSVGVGTIKDGATVEVTIDGIGTLYNRLAAVREG